jgi:hypothetical protein
MGLCTLLDIDLTKTAQALTQEQRNLSFPAFNKPREHFATALCPNPKSLGSALPIASVGPHADGAALKVA